MGLLQCLFWLDQRCSPLAFSVVCYQVCYIIYSYIFISQQGLFLFLKQEATVFKKQNTYAELYSLLKQAIWKISHSKNYITLKSLHFLWDVVEEKLVVLRSANNPIEKCTHKTSPSNSIYQNLPNSTWILYMTVTRVAKLDGARAILTA